MEPVSLRVSSTQLGSTGVAGSPLCGELFQYGEGLKSLRDGVSGELRGRAEEWWFPQPGAAGAGDLAPTAGGFLRWVQTSWPLPVSL